MLRAIHDWLHSSCQRLAVFAIVYANLRLPFAMCRRHRERHMNNLSKLAGAVDKGNRTDAVRLTKELLQNGTKPIDIVEQGLVPGMAKIGEKFKNNEAFVPELLIAARAMKESMAILEPLLVKAGVKPKFTAVIGTVQGDLHDIGKNLVAIMWKGANFAVVDLGANVPPERFVAAAKEHGAHVVGLSTLLTTTMPSMQTTVRALKAAGLDHVKVIVGGAPITQEFADEVGADGYAPDAASAVDVARDLAAA
jgi:5-methyltetrahydrofolate--homocysteine methyltransferase